jgi:hypothetical protein
MIFCVFSYNQSCYLIIVSHGFGVMFVFYKRPSSITVSSTLEVAEDELHSKHTRLIYFCTYRIWDIYKHMLEIWRWTSGKEKYTKGSLSKYFEYLIHPKANKSVRRTTCNNNTPACYHHRYLNKVFPLHEPNEGDDGMWLFCIIFRSYMKSRRLKLHSLTTDCPHDAECLFNKA